MPTPITTAKQCLNSEASHALEEAVKVARRLGHAQTTSLHLVYAFMSLSPSQLREACVRARNTGLNPRVQLKALDFCLSVSLERLPTSQPRVDEPPVANSLMAAIKRSQANQRRQPESIIAIRTQNQLLGQCQDQLGTPTSGVKVELRHLIVAILDDPTVSRVFNEAGFTSFDVKLAILRPFQSFFRYPQRGRGHQGLFFYNLDGNSDPGCRPFRFPFSGYWGNWGGQDNYRRIGEVLMRKKGRNPLLVGVCANDALRGFMEVLEKRMDMLPMELGGIKVISIEKDVLKFVNEQWSDEAMSLRFKEVGMMVQHCLGPGLMVSFGNLRYFLGGENGFGMDVLNSIVKKLTKLLEVHGGRVWLIGFAANDQTYVEFLSRFPSIDKEWDLHLLPITSIKPMMGGESCFKSSLMGSFVPFGGFFSSPPDLKVPFSSSYHVTCRSQCRQNFEQERCAFPKRGSMPSVADKHRTVVSPWLQMVEPVANSAYSDLKAKGGKMLLGDALESLQKDQNNVCQDLHYTQASTEPETSQECSQLATRVGSDYTYGKVTNVHNEKHLTSHPSNTVLSASSKNDDFRAKISEISSGTDHSPRGSSWLCISGADDSQTSPSGVSVVSELGLELFPDPRKQQKKDNAAVEKRHASKCSFDACFHLSGKPNSSNCKTLFEALFRRVGRQYEAVRKISQAIADSCVINGRIQGSGLRGDIWLNCVGPDLFGKRKIVLALANILYGSENNFIGVDFDSKDGLLLQTKVFDHQMLDGSDVKFRGKTAVDHIAEELRKTPFGIVFLENVQSADPMAQRSLSQAIKTGRFSDTYGREVPINNRIFVLSSQDNSTPSKEKRSNLLEERIASAKAWPIHITVRENTFNQIFVNKRKLGGTNETTLQFVSVDLVKRPHRGLGMSLDLNLPAEVNDGDDGRYDTWLEEFSSEVEKTSVKVVFDPFDYNALATKVLKWIHQSFHKAVGFECSLEIDPKVMEQILAAACLYEADNEVEDWIDQVLGKGFAEAQKRYQLTAHHVVIVTSFAPLYTEEQASEACLLPSKIVLP